MTKHDKYMGEPSISARRHEPIVEPHKTPKKVGKRKRRPFVLVERIKLGFVRNGEWVIKHHYETEKARAQARKILERSPWRSDKTTFEEYTE